MPENQLALVPPNSTVRNPATYVVLIMIEEPVFTSRTDPLKPLVYPHKLFRMIANFTLKICASRIHMPASDNPSELMIAWQPETVYEKVSWARRKRCEADIMILRTIIVLPATILTLCG